MTALPTPLNVPQGWVLRVFVGGRAYTSPLMSKGDAETLAAELEDDVVQSSKGHGFVTFTQPGGQEVRLRARSVTVIDPTPLHATDVPGRPRSAGVAP